MFRSFEKCNGLWRSEDMVRLDLILQREVLHDTIYEIGMLGKAQFVDLNETGAAFARPFTNEIRRCDEMQRKLNMIEEELHKMPQSAFAKYKDVDMSATVIEMRQAQVQWQIEQIDERVENTLTHLEAMSTSLRGLHNEMNYHRELDLLAHRLQGLLNSDTFAPSSSSEYFSGGGRHSKDHKQNYARIIHGEQTKPSLFNKLSRLLSTWTSKSSSSSSSSSLYPLSPPSFAPSSATTIVTASPLQHLREEEQTHVPQTRTEPSPLSSSSLRPVNTPLSSPTSRHVRSLSTLNNVIGLIPVTQSETLYRLCYRVARGNAVIDINNEPQPFVDPNTGTFTLLKATFAIFSSSRVIIARLHKLIVALGATVYSIDEILARQNVSISNSSNSNNHINRKFTLEQPEQQQQEQSQALDRNNTHALETTQEMSEIVLSPTETNNVLATPTHAHNVNEEQSANREYDYNTSNNNNNIIINSNNSNNNNINNTSSSSSFSHLYKDDHELQVALADVLRRKERLLRHWYREHRLYKSYLKVEKAVLTIMNMSSLTGSTCNASLWIARRHEHSLQRALDEALLSSGGAVRTIVAAHPNQLHPPTYFETNKFTISFQSIVDSYGMAHYKEVNPGVFTIITFPYLFGIMYGDIGHALLLLLIALFFISREKVWRAQELNEIIAMLFNGRYLLLLMSIFAFYMGLLYNDFFGFSVNLFTSGYIWDTIDNQHGTVHPTVPNGQPSVKPPRVYLFGLDVAWAETDNKLEFYNSVKMKHAVIVGVVQMFAGVFLSLFNYMHEKDWHRILYLFVPECVFLFTTFGYMSILIIVKWCTTWSDTHDAPSLLEIMTNFFLQPGAVSQPLFRGQAGLQIFLLIIAFLMVPVMLFGMPIVEIKAYNEYERRRKLGSGHATEIVISDDNVSYSNNRRGVDSNNNHNNNNTDENHYQSPPLQNELLTPTISNSANVQDNFSPFNQTSATIRNLDALSTTTTIATTNSNNNNNLVNWNINESEDVANQHTVLIHDENNEDDEAFAHFDLSEMIIHYVIHTIEYVLSSVSNTASYLRLWALSLAHAQLSEVFFTFAIVNVLDADNYGGALIAFGVCAWLAVTLGVLVGMEALSAFLHALRLHWVEFQNKFYAGDGYALEPLDLLGLCESKGSLIKNKYGK